MKQVVNWTAKRAGGRITIVGLDPETRAPIKIVGVDLIEARAEGGKPVATDKNGERYELV